LQKSLDSIDENPFSEKFIGVVDKLVLACQKRVSHQDNKQPNEYEVFSAQLC
jgi:hypothetical protein